MKATSILLFLLVLACISSCDRSAPTVSGSKPVILIEKPELVNGTVSKVIASTLSPLLYNQTLVLGGDSLFSTRFIVDFYVQQKFGATWTNQGRLSFQGDSLLRVLKNAGDDGLIVADYHVTTIDSLLKKDTKSRKFNVNKLAEADLLLTDAFFTYCVHINKGRLNKDSLTREWHPQYVDTNLVQLLKTAIRHNSIGRTIHALEPKHREYQSMKQALSKFKQEFASSYWDNMPYKKTDTTSFEKQMKKRLIASHDYAVNPSDTVTSDSIKLTKAIKNFQCRHYLVQDGKIGKLTLRALKQSKQDYINQLEMNLERWRLYSPPKEKRFVWVNIPKYEMRVMEADTLVMKSPVIVGLPDHPTPLLKSTITNFLIYPYWNVPYSIATKELLPILQRDTSYLRRKNFEVLNGFSQPVDPQFINWKIYSETYFPWRLRQQIGDDNSLGILKFNFNNKYGVYLHDTDNRRLFNREMRAMSHGCVRLEKFLDFAEFLIREDSANYPVDSLKIDLLKQQQKYVYMRLPIAIYISYFTAEVDKYDELFFFIDVYNRDEKMLLSLYKK